jgi:glycosyltransferase involved in cell wall biosynthesis
MQIGGFTYVRNGFAFGYPFLASLHSLLPLVDELVVAVGDSTDGTREAISTLENPKIKIIDTVWDESLRENGKIFAEQSDLALNNISGDWAIHLQVDEVLHENDQQRIADTLKTVNANKKVDGLLFPFLHFWGDYQHIRNTRRTHRFEIRAFRNTGNIRAYKDSQGFRNYEQNPKGEKLKVMKIDTPIYHYSYVRPPQLMTRKANYFHRFWHDDAWLKKNTGKTIFDYNQVDKLEPFEGSHPQYMKEIMKKKDWEFTYDPAQTNMKIKDQILYKFEKLTGIRPFEYRNYKQVKH